MQVANFLSLNGVEFEYEKAYQATPRTLDTGNTARISIFRHDIYIEHFALDEEGNPPVHFRYYMEGVKWKRSIHEIHKNESDRDL